MNSDAPSYRGYRFPADIIAYAVWLYFRFSLSFRDVEDLLAQRGITVTYETIRHWCRTFGQAYARRLRRRRGQLGDTACQAAGVPTRFLHDYRRTAARNLIRANVRTARGAVRGVA